MSHSATLVEFNEPLFAFLELVKRVCEVSTLAANDKLVRVELYTMYIYGGV
jgi:hypothetical protein